MGIGRTRFARFFEFRESRTISDRKRLAVICAAGAVVVFALTLAGADPAARVPGPGDRCPVCGMYVTKYPDWTAEIIFKDGAAVFFDGAKDLFKYYFKLNTYAPDRTDEDIAAVYVTEFYNLELIDARSSFFVIGSDVYGPMGRELIPFKTEADARQFKIDHKGQRILRFDQVNQREINQLD